MSTDIKLSQAQISKIIQSGTSFGFWLGNLGKKNINKCCYSFSWIIKQFNFKCNK